MRLALAPVNMSALGHSALNKFCYNYYYYVTIIITNSIIIYINTLTLGSVWQYLFPDSTSTHLFLCSFASLDQSPLINPLTKITNSLKNTLRTRSRHYITGLYMYILGPVTSDQPIDDDYKFTQKYTQDAQSSLS